MMHKPIVLHQVYKLPLARLYELLSQPSHLEAWFSPSADVEVKVLQHEFHTDGAYCLQYTDPVDGVVLVAGKFVQIEAPHLISFTWEWQLEDVHARIPTLVTWLLKEKGENTELTVIHESIPDADFFARHQAGWLGALHRLEQL